MTIQHKICLLLLLALCSVGVQAQNRLGPKLSRITLEQSKPGWLYFREGVQIEPAQFFTDYATDLGLSEFDDMRPVKEERDADGIYRHYFFQQYYKGVKVEEGQFTLHADKSGALAYGSGKIIRLDDAPFDAQITPVKAISIAQKEMGATRYCWEDPYWENRIKDRTGDPNASYYPKPELQILSDRFPLAAMEDRKGPRLAWKIDLNSAVPMHAARYYVDAQTGELLGSLAMESDCTGPVSVNTIFNGNRSISTEQTSSGPDIFRLNDDCTAAEIHIRDWNSSTLVAAPVEIQSGDNTWTNMNQQFGATVLWEVNRSYNYFLSTFGRNSYDGSNGDVDGYINAQFKDSNGDPYPDNASMSFTGGRLKVGLGSTGTLADCWGPLDVLGHEYTHAVTGSSAALVYSGESGALNESFSDIFGEMIEFNVMGSNDWLMGDDRSSGAIRDMANPSSFSDPDTYLKTNWKSTLSTDPDEGGVHSNSAILNLWFNLIAVGGTGTNDNLDNFAVSAIGRVDASSIAFTTLTGGLLTTTSDYPAARNATIMAADMLFGNCSFQTQQVINAWNAVGVYNTTGADCGCRSNVVESGVSPNTQIESSNWIKSTATIPSGTTVKYDADQYVLLQPGFLASNGSQFRAIIDGCFGAAAKPASLTGSEGQGQMESMPVSTPATVTNELSVVDFSVFPNPAQDQVTVALHMPQAGDGVLTVVDPQGKRIDHLSQNMSWEKGTNYIPLQLNDQQAGLYFVRITTGEVTITRPVVIMKN